MKCKHEFPKIRKTNTRESSYVRCESDEKDVTVSHQFHQNEIRLMGLFGSSIQDMISCTTFIHPLIENKKITLKNRRNRHLSADERVADV